MARLTIQADIDTHNAAIIADGIVPDMKLADVVFFLADKSGQGNIFDQTIWTGARNGATIWIEAGEYNGIDIGTAKSLKVPVDLATTANITLSGEQTIDGGVTSASRVLVKDQIDQTENGFYLTATGAWTRTTDLDHKTEIDDAVAHVTGGTVNANTFWRQITDNPDIGIDPIVWELTTLADNVTVPSDANNKNHIRFFGGQGVINKTASFAGRSIQFSNFDFLVVDFESNSFPGFRDGWGSGRSGTFGLLEKNTFQESGMGLNIKHGLSTMKSLEIRGCELSKGDFAKVRFLPERVILDKFIIERNLINRSHSGEGLYIGATTPADTGPPLFNNFIVRNNQIVCTMAEIIQLQQPGNGTRVHNNVLVVADMDYRSAFQPFQDTGTQWQLAQGDFHFFNNVIIGHGTAGMQFFSEDQTGETPSTPFGDGVPKIFNNVFTKGKNGITFRTHEAFVHAAKIIFRNNDVVSVAGGYEDVGNAAVDYRFDIAQVDVPVEIIGGRLPVGSVVLNPGEPNTNVRHFNISIEAQSEPQFVNSGFDNIPFEKITKWAPSFLVGNFGDESSTTSIDPALLIDGGIVSMTIQSGKGFAAGHLVLVQGGIQGGVPTKSFYATVTSYIGTALELENISNRVGSGASNDWIVGRRIPYTVGEFVWLTERFESFPYELYHCILAHDSAGPGTFNTRPNNSPTHWEKIQWDANGKNSKDPLYNGTPVTTDFMEVAGDFRLKKGTPHHDLLRGLQCNEQRDDRTRYGWQWKQTEGGTIRDIPGAYGNKLVLADYSYLIPGRFYRFFVEKLDAAGFKPKLFSAWKQI